MAARKEPSKGGKPDKLWRDALMLSVNEFAADGKTKKLRQLADKVIERALDGDMTAAKEIGDRLDGKPAQQQIITGDEMGGPAVIQVITGVPPRDDN